MLMAALTLALAALFTITLLARISPALRTNRLFLMFVLRRWQWQLLCICFLTVFCVGCAGTDAVFSVLLAALAGVDVVVTGLGSLIAPGEASLINGAVTAIAALVAAVQAAWDTYEANPSAAGALDAVQAAVLSLQTQLPGILSALNITNATLKAWITTVVGLVGKLADDIAADILPKMAEAAAAHAAGDDTLAKSLHDKFIELSKAFIVAHNAALEQSGLPPAIIANVKKAFNAAAKHPAFGQL
jgi:hypothetical protein